MQAAEMQARALPDADPGSRCARNRTMDVLKAFGIISIVLAHATPPGIVVEVVQIYYIAIFFFVSGYLFKPEYFSDLGMLARRRLLPLYAVFVAWNLSYLVYEIGIVTPLLRPFGVDLGLNHEIAFAPRAAAAIILKGSAYSMGGALWFITSLITATALFGLIGALARRLPERASWVFIRAAVLACFFVGFGESTALRWPAHADTALVGLLVLYAGFRYREYEGRIPIVPLIAVLCAAEVFLLRGQVDMTVDTYAGVAAFFISVGSGIYALLFAASRLQNSRLLSDIGRNTLFIAATHFLAFKLVALAHIAIKHLSITELGQFPTIADGTWWVAYFMAGIAIPLAVKMRLVDPALEAWHSRRATRTPRSAV